MRYRITVILLSAVALAFSGAAIPGAQPLTIKVGLLAPSSGPNPEWGRRQMLGMEMAVDEVNRRGGIAGTPLEAVILDIGDNPKLALNSYRRMAKEERVLAVIGPSYSDVFQVLSPATNDLKVVIIATSGVIPGLCDLKVRPYAFRMSLTSDKKEGPLAKAWVTAHGIKSVVILHDGDSSAWIPIATELWPALMKELDVQVLNLNAPMPFRLGERDFRTLVKQVAAYRPDGICISGFPEEVGYFIKELREQGLSQPVMGSSGVASSTVIEIAGEAAEGLWSNVMLCLEDPNPKLQAYAREFKKRCTEQYPSLNCDAEQFDETVYDILLLLADVMRKKGITGDREKIQEERDKIREGLATMGAWRGVAGVMAFDKMGDGIRSVHVVKVQGGKWRHAQ